MLVNSLQNQAGSAISQVSRLKSVHTIKRKLNIKINDNNDLNIPKLGSQNQIKINSPANQKMAQSPQSAKLKSMMGLSYGSKNDQPYIQFEEEITKEDF